MMLIYIIVGVYIALCALFYFGQHLFFFRPEILPAHFKYEYPFPFDEHTLDAPDGGKINAIHFKVPNSLGVVYYLKGNSRSIKGWGKFAKDFLGKGYDFFMMDYRGFGKSTGKRSEKLLYQDAQQVYDWLADKYNPEDMVVYGRSFGSGIAAYVTAHNKARMLILDSPYYNFLYQTKRFGGWLPLKWLLKYKIPTHTYLKKTQCPVYIIHGNRDYIIPFKQGVMLAEQTPNAQLIPIEKGRHNNLPEFPQFHQELYKILKTKLRSVER